MKRFLSILARHKYYFDLGQGSLTVINFVLLATDKFSSLTNLSIRGSFLLLIPIAAISVWALGFFLDFFGFSSAYQEELNKRNEMLRKAVQ